MTLLAFKKYLINEFARKQIKITQKIYEEITLFINSEEGKQKYKVFLNTKLPGILNKNKYQGYESDLIKLKDAVPERLIDK